MCAHRAVLQVAQLLPCRIRNQTSSAVVNVVALAAAYTLVYLTLCACAVAKEAFHVLTHMYGYASASMSSWFTGLTAPHDLHI